MRINQVVRTLVISDFFVNAGFSVFAPVVAIFITHQISGGTIETVGFGAAIVQIFKVLVELPVAKILDKNHGEYDDFYSLMFGSILIATVPFLYLFAKEITHIYIIQAIYGVGIAFTAPPWYAIFSRHLDKMQESFEWSLDSVSIGLAAAGAAAFGGLLAQKYGFNFVFIIGGLFAIFGSIMQIRIFKHIKKKVPKGQVSPLPDKVT
jgi:MFS family permease